MPLFAQAICAKLRHIILQADPAIRENWKWSAPVYERNGLVCSYTAFKQHVRFSFFQGAYLADPAKILTEGENNATMRSLKFTDVTQVNEALLQSYIQEAAQLALPTSKKPAQELTLPPYLRQLLAQNREAKQNFEKLAYTHRKEYVVWLEQAKKPETRAHRLEQTLLRLTQSNLKG
jgi:uncharacterized protein YdeI (YjbR/CyaY-like superfamily)